MNHSGHKYTKDKGNKRKATRVQKACLSCRKRKQGCEEQRPCFRCVEKGVECVEVDEKKKRGRARTYPPKFRERSYRPRNEEITDYGEDENEDSYSGASEADDPISSEEDQQSPRGCSSNSSSCSGHHSHEQLSRGHRRSDVLRNSNGSVTASVVTHTLQLDGSSPTSNSFSLNSSNLSSYATDSSSRSSSPENLPDSPSQADVGDGDLDEDQLSSVNFDCRVEDTMSYLQIKECFVPPKSNRGIGLALLLPFIANLNNESDEKYLSSPMLIDEDYGQLFDTHLQAGEFTEHQPIFSLCSESLELREKLVSSGLPYISSALANGSFPTHFSEDGDSRAQLYLKGCLQELLMKQKKSYFESHVQRANDTWKNILRCFRSGEWQKAQNALQEIETMQFDGFGQQVEPAIVYWSSGGRIHHANEAFCKLVGYTLQELRVDTSDRNENMGKAPHLFFHPEEMMKVMQKLLLASQKPEYTYHHMNTRLLSKQRKEIPVSCSILNLKESVGTPLLNIAMFV